MDLYIESVIDKGYMAPKDIKCYNSPVKRSGFQIATSTTYHPRDEDEKVIKFLQIVSDKCNFELVIHDLAKKEERKKGKLKGIASAPVFVFEGQKFSDALSDEEAFLKHLGLPDIERKELISLYGLNAVKKDGIVCKNCGSHNLKICEDGSGMCNDCKKAFI